MNRMRMLAELLRQGGVAVMMPEGPKPQGNQNGEGFRPDGWKESLNHAQDIDEFRRIAEGCLDPSDRR